MGNDNCDILNKLYDKKITCPVCNNKFLAKVVKSKVTRIKSKDSDFFIRYLDANPYFFDVWICDKCGYAAIKTDFPNIKNYEKEIIQQKITPKWKPRNLNAINNPQEAIEKYKLALITAITLKRKNSSIAFILLKIAWMYRLLDNQENEQTYLKDSLKCFINAYSTEDFPICGLTRDSLTYLIGDLYRRTNQNKDALFWYSKTLTTIGASPKIKELARNGKDLISSDKSKVPE